MTHSHTLFQKLKLLIQAPSECSRCIHCRYRPNLSHYCILTNETTKRIHGCKFYTAIINFESTKNKNINLKKAGLSMRLINVLIDLLIIYVLFMSGLLINASIHKPSDEQLTPLVVGGMLLLLTLFYYFVFEYITKRTPAKWITGTKVITKRGTSPTLKQILIRTLTRFLPIQIWLLFRNKRMYLHDKWSHTMVITAD